MDEMPSIIRTHRTYTVAQPAANTEWSQVVPTGKFWLVKAISVTLVQGTGQTPQPVLVLADAAGNVFAESVGCTTVQAASTTCQYTWAAEMVQSGTQGSAADVHSQAPLPVGSELGMPQNWTISSHTIGKGANTQYGAVVIYVAENPVGQ